MTGGCSFKCNSKQRFVGVSTDLWIRPSLPGTMNWHESICNYKVRHFLQTLFPYLNPTLIKKNIYIYGQYVAHGSISISCDSQRHLVSIIQNFPYLHLSAAKTALTRQGMESTRPPKVHCGIWHKAIGCRSFRSCKLWDGASIDKTAHTTDAGLDWNLENLEVRSTA